jgi:hypothetical protein
MINLLWSLPYSLHAKPFIANDQIIENLSYLVGWKDDVDMSGDAWETTATTFNGSAGYPQQKIRRVWEMDYTPSFDVAHHCKIRCRIDEFLRTMMTVSRRELRENSCWALERQADRIGASTNWLAPILQQGNSLVRASISTTIR